MLRFIVSQVSANLDLVAKDHYPTQKEHEDRVVRNKQVRASSRKRQLVIDDDDSDAPRKSAASPAFRARSSAPVVLEDSEDDHAARDVIVRRRSPAVASPFPRAPAASHVLPPSLAVAPPAPGLAQVLAVLNTHTDLLRALTTTVDGLNDRMRNSDRYGMETRDELSELAEAVEGVADEVSNLQLMVTVSAPLLRVAFSC